MNNPPQAPRTRPQVSNLLFILSDQHNRDTLGCYGHPLVRTPNLDRLACRGSRFDSAYTNCPICVPSRASLATGRYVHQTRCWDNAHPYDGRLKSWGHRLRSAGHQVDAIGKLHYRDAQDDNGFSNTILPMHVFNGVGDIMGSIRDEPPIYKMEREDILNAGPGTSPHLDYDAEVASRACDWLKGKAHPSRTRGKPWALFVSFVCPHPPFVAPSELYRLYCNEKILLPVQNRIEEQPMHPALVQLRRTLYQDKPLSEEEVRRVTATYYAMCTYLDSQVGRVLEALTHLGLEHDTRIIYTSDHGESMGRRGLWGKFTMYEESAAVPLIMAGPDIPQGRVFSEPVSLVDCYPTILECLGLPLTDSELAFPGQTLWPVMENRCCRRFVFSEYHAVGSTSASYMVRTGRTKYIHYVGEQPQLFDLQSDPLEEHDLVNSAAHRHIVHRFQRLLRSVLDPEKVDAEAKADQRVLIEKYGGREKVLRRGTFGNTPVPGQPGALRPDAAGESG